MEVFVQQWINFSEFGLSCRWDCHGLPVENEINKKLGEHLTEKGIRILSLKNIRHDMSFSRVHVGVREGWSGACNWKYVVLVICTKSIPKRPD